MVKQVRKLGFLELFWVHLSLQFELLLVLPSKRRLAEGLYE